MITRTEIRKDGTFVLEGKLDQPQRSASGKTFVVLSTHGNKAVAGENGKQYSVGLNVYTKEQ